MRFGSGGIQASKRALKELGDEEIVSRFTADLLALFPELEGKLDQGILRRHPRGRAVLGTRRACLVADVAAANAAADSIFRHDDHTAGSGQRRTHPERPRSRRVIGP
jgi:hypothetical protein